MAVDTNVKEVQPITRADGGQEHSRDSDDVVDLFGDRGRGRGAWSVPRGRRRGIKKGQSVPVPPHLSPTTKTDWLYEHGRKRRTEPDRNTETTQNERLYI